MTTGLNRDMLPTVGWLDLTPGPQILHVPNFAGCYYSVQFTDPSKNTNFAYVGTGATGAQERDYLITGPGWKGQVPERLNRILSPNYSVLVLGLVLVYSESDLPDAYDLAKQIQLIPLIGCQPSD